MNMDIKSFNKLLTKRIQQYIKKNYTYDQVVFIPGMQVWLHSQQSINVIYHINRPEKKKIT